MSTPGYDATMTPEQLTESVRRIEKSNELLESVLQRLEKDRQHTPRILWGVLLAIPVAIFWKLWIAIFVALLMVVFFVMATYFYGVRCNEWRQRIDDNKRAILLLQSEATHLQQEGT